MISYAQALQHIREAARTAKPPGVEFVDLEAASGRIAAADVLSPEALPHYANSSMDGFAVRSEWTLQSANPMRLPVLGTIVAGDVPPDTGARTGAWEIMTGAPFPEGLDACIRVEDVTVHRNSAGKPIEIEFSSPATRNQNVRDAGGDFQPGDLILSRGTMLGPEQILALAALGITRLSVFRKARIALLSTGKEIIDAKAPLRPGQIRNSTAPFLKAAAAQLGHELSYCGMTDDEPETFERAMHRILRDPPDLVITTGAVSMGIHDFVSASLKKLGAEVLFHKVAIRPGKPVLFARFPGGPAVFALPGNPISTVVGLRFFAEPYFRELFGMREERPIRARLQANSSKPEGLRCFFKASLKLEQGEPTVEVLPGQMSSMMSPLLLSNAWAILEEEGTTAKQGDWIDVYPMYAPRHEFSGIDRSPGSKGSEKGCC